MATTSLRGNLEIACTSFSRNLGILLAQAREAQRVHALEGARNRKVKPDLADWHFQGFDEASEVMEWVGDAKELVARCPMVREEKAGENGDKMPSASDIDTPQEKSGTGIFNSKEFTDDDFKNELKSSAPMPGAMPLPLSMPGAGPGKK